MDELKSHFVEEAREILTKLEPLVLQIEKEFHREVLEELFRAVHTLKGSAGIAGVVGVSKLAHCVENLLEKLRSGEAVVSSQAADVLFMSIDALASMVVDLENGVDLPPPDELLEEIEGCLKLEVTKSSDISCQPAEGSGAEENGNAASTYRLQLNFGQDFFKKGHNLDYLLSDLESIGQVIKIDVDFSGVPPLRSLDPEDYYLSWEVFLKTSAPREEIEGLFVFIVDEENKVGIEKLQGDSFERSEEENEEMSEEQVGWARRLLGDQLRALESADDEVLPGLLSSVKTVIERLGSKVKGLNLKISGLPAQLDSSEDLKKSRKELAEFIRKVLAEVLPEEKGKKVAEEGAGAADNQLKVGTAGAARDKRSNIFKVRRVTAEALMNLVGELIVAKNSLPYLVKKLEHFGLREQVRELADSYHYIDRIARDIQEQVMDIWLLPVEEVFSRFPRFVRDNAKKLNKAVEVVLEGGDTRLDRNIIEEIYEPLTHLVRNSLDHGIEEIEERIRLGKNPTGIIELRAWRQGDHVYIKITDDGKGIDVRKIEEKAVAMGLVEREQLEAMSEEEKMRLIFLPGVSSKEEISDLSGRGVGMDVVENTIRRLGGSVEVHSVVGSGTSFILSLPFTMATTEVLVVRIGKGTYGIPLSAVRETVRLDKEIDKERIKTLRGKLLAVLRGELIPLLNSYQYLGEETLVQEEVVLVVLHQKVAVPVDAVVGKEEIIIKPLSGDLKNIPYLMGAAVMGDGKVLLILEPNELPAWVN